MNNHIFMLGGYGVRPSDLIASLALIVSIASAIFAAISAKSNVDRLRFDREKEEAKSKIKVVVLRRRGGDDTTLIDFRLIAPEDGRLYELRDIYFPNNPSAVHNIEGRTLKMSPIRLCNKSSDTTEETISLSIHEHGNLSGPIMIRLDGIRRDETQTPVSVEFIAYSE